MNEYFTIQRTIDKVAAARPATVAEARAAFERQKEIEYSIVSITSKDLQITKENDRVVIAFAYDKEVPIAGPGLPADQVRGPLEVARPDPHHALEPAATTPCSSASATASARPGCCTRALTHRSHGADHNERLEFLGDAVLNLAVSGLLLRPPRRQSPEGDLTRVRGIRVRVSTTHSSAT